MPKYQPYAIADTSDEMVRGYLDAAEWSGLDEDSQFELETTEGPVAWSEAAVREATEICERFRNAFHDPNFDEAQAGHDLWLTRNGHGAGFDDGDWWDEAFVSYATKFSKALGERNVWFEAGPNLLHFE